MNLATPTTLAANLRKALDEQGRTVRGLAIDSGLLPDAVRNVLRGLSKNPAPESLDAVARVLGISVAALYGDEPWPAASVATKPPAKPSRKRASARTSSLSLPEYELRPGGPERISDNAPVGIWSMPSEAVGARGLGGDLAIVRAPCRLEDIATGDCLLVDLAGFARVPSPPGILVVWDGIGHVLARVGMVGQGKVSIDIGQGAPRVADVESVDISARVLGKWTWV